MCDIEYIFYKESAFLSPFSAVDNIYKNLCIAAFLYAVPRNRRTNISFYKISHVFYSIIFLRGHQTSLPLILCECCVVMCLCVQIVKVCDFFLDKSLVAKIRQVRLPKNRHLSVSESSNVCESVCFCETVFCKCFFECFKTCFFFNIY